MILEKRENALKYPKPSHFENEGEMYSLPMHLICVNTVKRGRPRS